MPEALETHSPYPAVAPQGNFSAIEEEVIDRWRREETFTKSIAQRPSSNEYVFYDGPPFANGLPHYGHLLTGFIKDAIPRYRTMRGQRVTRRFGWDCHGLPAEMGAENELGIHGGIAIEEFGIANFNDYCRTSVLRYTDEWGRYVSRQARWVDFNNDYKTMDLPYMESVIWAFKELYDKGLIYEGYKVMPYSWAAETVLSNFETKMDDSYRERQDPALTILFELEANKIFDAPTKVLAWTTTPWTLPSNLALAVGPDVDYSVFLQDGAYYVVGSAVAGNYEKELTGAELHTTLKGRDLVGLSYTPLFDYFKDQPNAFKILEADFVSTDEGTGIVHIAPGFGEDDQRVSEDNGIAVVCPVNDQGRFTSDVTDYAGMNVFEANPVIIKDLKAAGKIVRHDTIVHSYPHCWRTDQPLIYRAMSSWFVKVTAIKERMLELNQQINWVPDHVKDGAFGKWLENARDWSISRNRFWGSPIPVWVSDNPEYPRMDVYGSLDQLEADFGVRPDDLHRPAIDALTRPNPDDPTGNSTMRRVPHVLDCWFESGSMPFAQVHYPFENREWFDRHFPADFIVEYIGQTRGWFYTLHVLGTALFDKPPFQNCLAHGIVLGDDGRKMSKRLQNYPSPDEVFDQYGADAMRWFLLSSGVVRGNNLITERKGFSEAIRSALNPLWNVLHFFTLYANTDAITATYQPKAEGVLDRYMLSKLGQTTAQVTDLMDSYDLPGAAQSIVDLLEVLTNWYIRRSRERFWGSEYSADKQAAYDTTFTVLANIAKLAAPLLPMLSEHVYTTLGFDDSVHLAQWPDPSEFEVDLDLISSMDTVRDICSQGLSIRADNRLRVRLPLPAITVVAPNAESVEPFRGLIADELNVKEVLLETEPAKYATSQVQLDARIAGPRLGPSTSKVIAAIKNGEWHADSQNRVVAADEVLLPQECTVRLIPNDPAASRVLSDNSGLVILDLNVTDELFAEGLARDIVRVVQNERKERDLHVADRISLVLLGSPSAVSAARAHTEMISSEVLATHIEIDPLHESAETKRHPISDDNEIAVIMAVAR